MHTSKLTLYFTMKPQEVKSKTQTDWLGFCKGAQCPQSVRLCV